MAKNWLNSSSHKISDLTPYFYFVCFCVQKLINKASILVNFWTQKINFSPNFCSNFSAKKSHFFVYFLFKIFSLGPPSGSGSSVKSLPPKGRNFSVFRRQRGSDREQQRRNERISRNRPSRQRVRRFVAKNFVQCWHHCINNKITQKKLRTEKKIIFENFICERFFLESNRSQCKSSLKL